MPCDFFLTENWTFESNRAMTLGNIPFFGVCYCCFLLVCLVLLITVSHLCDEDQTDV